jgi:hypothetical protein
MNIILLGGCNWVGRHLMHKLLFERQNFHLTWVDNLSSEYSTRNFTWEFEYLKNDCYDFKYGDITNYTFLDSILTKDAIVIYNIWKEPDSIIGMNHICQLVNKYNLKLIYTTSKTLTNSYEHIINTHALRGVTGIEYNGELIGDYGIWNKRDILETHEYYKRIGNKIDLNMDFEYYTMESATQFIYFFIIQPMEDNLLIKQPTQRNRLHL